MPKLDGDADLYAKCVITSFGSAGATYRDFLKRYVDQFPGSGFEADVRKLGFANGRDALKSSDEYVVTGDVVRIKASEEIACVLDAIDKSKPKRGRNTRGGRSSPFRVVACGDDRFYGSSSSSFNRNSGGYRNGPTRSFDSPNFMPVQSFRSFGQPIGQPNGYPPSTSMLREPRPSNGNPNQNSSNWNRPYSSPPSEVRSRNGSTREYYEKEAADRTESEITVDFDKSPGKLNESDTESDVTPQPTVERADYRAFDQKNEGEDSLVMTVDGLQLFGRHLDQVAQTSMEVLERMFTEIETFGDSDAVRIFDLKGIFAKHHLDEVLNIKKFVALFSLFRPQWKLTIYAEHVNFKLSTQPPVSMVKTFLAARVIPKRELMEGTATTGQIVAVGQSSLIYVRPSGLAREYANFVERTQLYAKILFDDKLKTPQEPIGALFVGDCVFWRESDRFLRCEVLNLLPPGRLELMAVDVGRRFEVPVEAANLFAIPHQLREHPPFCIPFESDVNGQPMSPQITQMIRKVAVNAIEQQMPCVFSFNQRLPSSTVLDLYRGVWKPMSLPSKG